MAKSIELVNFLDKCDVCIYDDASTEYNIKFLKEIFPFAKKIHRNSVNVKADKNMYYMFKDFLESKNEYLLIADSDLIFNKRAIEFAVKKIKKTDGILSLFNTANHKVKKVYDEDLCIKEHIGAAGTLFSRVRVEEIVNKFTEEDTKWFDWKWSAFFTISGYKIFCVRKSLVQHIGLVGQNTNLTKFDYGEGFVVDSLLNGQIINDMIAYSCSKNTMTNNRSFLKKIKNRFTSLRNKLKYIIIKTIIRIKLTKA